MPTIKDVAKKANVSVATVSRVINNTGYVNVETRKIVEKAIDDLNYIPNELARSLFRKTSNIISIMVPHISTYFFSQLIEAIESAVTSRGFKLMIFNTKDDKKLEERYLNVMNQYNVDGLILVANTRNSEKIKHLKFPLLTIDHILDELIPSITSNNVQGGQLAAKKLIQSGADNIIHFRGPSDLITVVDRAKGFYEVMDENGIDVFTFDLDFKNPDLDDIEMFIKRHPDVNGIFCSSDIIALYVISTLQKLKYNVPEDVQIIGFDNIELAGILLPKLTTVAQPINKIGETATKYLIQLIKKQKLEKKHTLLDVELIERQTTK
ncbi:MAG: LacI family transcriptional regulator [Candidatus Izimaplasma sp.]|nr:LacI family transcriptional regulator [Candidatus Izimaplasma bacterium]